MWSALVELLEKAPPATVILLVGLLSVIVAVVGQLPFGKTHVELKIGKRVALGLLGAAMVALIFYTTTVIIKHPRQIPVERLLLIEEDRALDLHDGAFTFYVRAPDIHRMVGTDDDSKRFAEIEFDSREDFSSRVALKVYPGNITVFGIEGRRYKVSYRELGMLDAPPHEKQGHTRDFILLYIERE